MEFGKNLIIKIANLGIIHKAIKSAGRRYTISLLVNYTGNNELCSFYCSMLRPNNSCRKHLILSFYQRKKKSSKRRQWLPAKICRSCKKKLTNYEYLALSKTKKQTQVASGLHQTCALCCWHGKHIESTVPTNSQVVAKNKTFLLNHSLACANHAIYLAIHTCIFKEGRKKQEK